MQPVFYVYNSNINMDMDIFFGHIIISLNFVLVIIIFHIDVKNLFHTIMTLPVPCTSDKTANLRYMRVHCLYLL